VCQPFPARLRSVQPRPNHDCADPLIAQHGGRPCASHQSQRRTEGQIVAGNLDIAGASALRCLGREKRRALHRTDNHHDLAARIFVAGRVRRPQSGRRDPGERRSVRQGQIDRHDLQRSAQPRSGRQSVNRFESPQRDGERRCRLSAPCRTRIGIKAAGLVDRNHGRRRIQPCRQRGIQCTAADAEQGVHHQRRGRRRHRLDRTRPPRPHRPRLIGGRIGKSSHPHRPAALGQMTSHHIAVTAIIARPAGDEHLLYG